MRAPGVRLARRDQARQRARRDAGSTCAGRRALDVGASTGRLHRLPAAARRPRGDRRGRRLRELDYRLRNDPRVAVLERTNARALTPAMLPAAHGAPGLPDLATIDVSFISLAKVLARGARLPGRPLRRARAGQAAVRGRPRRASARAASCATPTTAARRSWASGEAALALGASRARLPLLGAARAEGQPRDVHLAGRARGRRGDAAGRAHAASSRQMARKVRAVREITVFTHRRPRGHAARRWSGSPARARPTRA